MTKLDKKIHNERLKYLVNFYFSIGFGIFAIGFIEPLKTPNAWLNGWYILFGVIVVALGPVWYRGLRDV